MAAHHHGSTTKYLAIACVMALSFAVIEAVFGWYANSLALLSDAGHLAADGLALVLGVIAAWIAQKPPSKIHTYGLGRAEVIGAWLSSLSIVFIAIWIIIEAVERLRAPEEVNAGIVIGIGAVAIILNLLIVWVLSRGEKTLNVRAAMLHVLGDLVGSVGAVLAGLIIYVTGWVTADPLLSILIAVLIIISSFRLLRESMNVLMEGVPPHLDSHEIRKALREIPHVDNISDLHIWTLSSGLDALSAHITLQDIQQWPSIKVEIKQLLKQQYNISHITIQPDLAEKQ